MTENSSSTGSNGLGTILPKDGNRAGYHFVTLNFKKSENGHGPPPKKRLSVTCSHAVFSLLSTYDDSVMQAMIWLHMVWFDASYANLRQPHILKHHIQVQKTSLASQ